MQTVTGLVTSSPFLRLSKKTLAPFGAGKDFGASGSSSAAATLAAGAFAAGSGALLSQAARLRAARMAVTRRVSVIGDSLLVPEDD